MWSFLKDFNFSSSAEFDSAVSVTPWRFCLRVNICAKSKPYYNTFSTGIRRRDGLDSLKTNVKSRDTVPLRESIAQQWAWVCCFSKYRATSTWDENCFWFQTKFLRSAVKTILWVREKIYLNIGKISWRHWFLDVSIFGLYIRNQKIE